MMVTWRTLIAEEMSLHDEPWEDIIACAPKEIDWDKEFYDGYGSCEGQPFTVWTKERVYFPTCYDGSEDVASVPRNPCNKVTEHIGGG